ncbi:MAG: hypothetical protein ACRD22_02795 [Terriglobia bacterium]
MSALNTRLLSMAIGLMWLLRKLLTVTAISILLTATVMVFGLFLSANTLRSQTERLRERDQPWSGTRGDHATAA